MTRKIEKAIAASSFVTAALLAFTSMWVREDNDITANVLLAMAQFLTLTCTLLGIDYKFNSKDYQLWQKRNQLSGGLKSSESS